MIERNDPCWCKSGQKWKKCHFPQKAPLSPEETAKFYRNRYDILIKTPEEITKIHAACKFSANLLQKLCQMAKVGVTTNELDRFAYEAHQAAGAHPAPLGYGTPPYPKSICTSLNEVICHGIPNDLPLKEGDIVNIDVSSLLDGYYGDCSAMVIIGKTDPVRENVVETARLCLEDSIAIVKPGLPILEIGKVIEARARANGCSVVTEFTGHGIGSDLHEAPQILHCYNHDKTPLAPGMTFTIEPMINAGKSGSVIDPDSGWIVSTVDKKPSAQWEHTLLVTETGCSILTLPD